jgi:hypothetical protein
MAQQTTGRKGSSIVTVLISFYMIGLYAVTFVSSEIMVVWSRNEAVSELGFLGLVLADALFVFAFGLLAAKPWAYLGSIGLNAAFIGLQLVVSPLDWWRGYEICLGVLIFLSGACMLFLLPPILGQARWKGIAPLRGQPLLRRSNTEPALSSLGLWGALRSAAVCLCFGIS